MEDIPADGRLYLMPTWTSRGAFVARNASAKTRTPGALQFTLNIHTLLSLPQTYERGRAIRENDGSGPGWTAGESGA